MDFPWMALSLSSMIQPRQAFGSTNLRLAHRHHLRLVHPTMLFPVAQMMNWRWRQVLNWMICSLTREATSRT